MNDYSRHRRAKRRQEQCKQLQHKKNTPQKKYQPVQPSKIHSTKSVPALVASQSDIEDAFYNALIRKNQHYETQKEENRQKLFQKIGRKDYSHLRSFKAWWYEWGNMFVQLWKMRKLRQEDMHEYTFTQALMKAVLSSILRLCGIVTQFIGCLYIFKGLVELLNWQSWDMLITAMPMTTPTPWYCDVVLILLGVIIGVFAMFLKFTRWELEQSKDSNYLMGIISIVVSILLCLLFPS